VAAAKTFQTETKANQEITFDKPEIIFHPLHPPLLYFLLFLRRTDKKEITHKHSIKNLHCAN